MNDDEIQISDIDEISPASKEMDEWVVNIEARLDSLDVSRPTRLSIDHNSADEEIPSIFGNWQCWDNFGASFLPENKKWEFVAYMKKWCGLNIRSYLEELQEKEDLVWRYYRGFDEQFRAENSKNFIEHLLVNSCFLIFAMVILTKNEHLMKILGEIVDKKNNPKDQRSTDEFDNLSQFIFRDKMGTQCYMLTMDYQIPWFVVETVYTKHSNLSNKLLDTPIHKLAISCFEELYPPMHKSKVNDDTNTLPPDGFKHLLHIFHWSRSPKGKFLLEMKSRPPKRMDSFYIPSATDLQLSENIFQKHAGGSIDVSYYDRRSSGVMELAPWHLFDYNIKIYESMLRFERCYLNCGLPFTAYVSCMVCLLQTEADVILLRANGIVPRTTNDEKDVLRYVQEFKTLLHDYVSMSDDLYDLLNKVKVHHERSGTPRYYTKLLRRYCATSAIAGIILFTLSFTQTLYGTLSYYKQ